MSLAKAVSVMSKNNWAFAFPASCTTFTNKSFISSETTDRGYKVGWWENVGSSTSIWILELRKLATSFSQTKGAFEKRILFDVISVANSATSIWKEKTELVNL